LADNLIVTQDHGLISGTDASKLALRIEVEINRNDKLLRNYRRWARDIGMDRMFMKIMRRGAGPNANDYDWYIYFGVVKPPFHKH
jgi:hypothetical protein